MKLYKKYWTAVIAVSVLFILPCRPAGASEMTPQSIVQRSFDNTRISGTESVITLSIFNAKGKSRVRKIASVTKLYDKGKTEKRLIRFLSPADVKGTGLLTYDYEEKSDDIWFFAPALRKARRIISSEKAKNFMGSEFTYADMTPPPVSEFNYKRLPDEQFDGLDCYVIESIPKNDNIADENGFSKRIATIAKTDFVARKAIYYDLDGELWKELAVKGVKLLDAANKKYRATEMKMVNKQNGRYSTIYMNKIQLSADVKDDYFSIRYLERP
jgi:hypothetical protein